MPQPPSTKPYASETDLPPELREVLTKVRECKESAEKVHKVYRERWDELYGLWRNYRRLVNAHADAQTDKDRGGVILGAQREWGGPLFIPYAFAIVETTVPRILSNDPRMRMKARREGAKQSAQAVEELINNTQLEIGYDLKLQAVARAGILYGIGVQKTFWHKIARKVRQTVPSSDGKSYAAVLTEQVDYEGPDVEAVDNRDFFWDPVAIDIPSCRWVIHRTWRDFDYIKGKVERGEWFPLDLDAVKRMSPDTSWATLHEARYQSAGLGDVDLKSDDLHEIWEYHSGDYVTTVLDNALVVQHDVTPFYHRQLPFQIYRPVHADHEFVGVGVIEPVKHMQYELNTLRGQRRDNATVALQRPFIFRSGRADPATFKMGPSVGIEILGDPTKDIVPLEFGDLPGSAYQEEQAIKEDIERATGISDSLAGGSGDGTVGSDTATGIQLTQQAAGERLKNMNKNLLREVVRPAGSQFRAMFRQHVIDPDNPRVVRTEDPNEPAGYRFTTVGPAELGDDMDGPIPDAGSTEPDDPIGREQKATGVYQELSGNPEIDQRKLVLYRLSEAGVPDPENFLSDDTGNTVDIDIARVALLQLGVPDELITEALEAAQMASEEAEQEGAEETPPGQEPAPEEAPVG